MQDIRPPQDSLIETVSKFCASLICPARITISEFMFSDVGAAAPNTGRTGPIYFSGCVRPVKTVREAAQSTDEPECPQFARIGYQRWPADQKTAFLLSGARVGKGREGSRTIRLFAAIQTTPTTFGGQTDAIEPWLVARSN